MVVASTGRSRFISSEVRRERARAANDSKSCSTGSAWHPNGILTHFDADCFPHELLGEGLSVPRGSGLPCALMGRLDATIVRFKRDLRISDRRPLVAVAESGGPIIALYIAEPPMHLAEAAHPAHWKFVRSCLVPLRDDLAAVGASPVVRVGESVEVLEWLCLTYSVSTAPRRGR